jgi:NAD(P)-binding Rossmann-like domain
LTVDASRRALLAATALAAAACTPRSAVESSSPSQAPAAWVGVRPERGHRLRAVATLPAPTVQRRAAVLVVGGGIAGLSAARAFARQGVDDVVVLELDDQPGGNSRGHQLAGMACPLGAHYLPLPTAASREVSDWLHELGLLRQHLGRTVADERHLCHSPQERLFVDGAWAEGLLPPADPASDTAAQYRRFAAAVRAVQGSGERRFSLPAHRSAWTPELAALTRRPSRTGWPRSAWTTSACAGTWTTAAVTTTAPVSTPCRPGPGCTTSPAATTSTHRAKTPANARRCSPGPRATPGWCSAWPRRWVRACMVAARCCA